MNPKVKLIFLFTDILGVDESKSILKDLRSSAR